MGIKTVRVYEKRYTDYTVYADTDEEACEKVQKLRDHTEYGTGWLEYDSTSDQSEWDVTTENPNDPYYSVHAEEAEKELNRSEKATQLFEALRKKAEQQGCELYFGDSVN